MDTLKCCKRDSWDRDGCYSHNKLRVCSQNSLLIVSVEASKLAGVLTSNRHETPIRRRIAENSTKRKAGNSCCKEGKAKRTNKDFNGKIL